MASAFDCQAMLGWIQLYSELINENRRSEVLMDIVVAAASQASEDSLGVKETAPIKPLPPAKREE
eukprot:16439738-Heterocapsa_arctica.AAC.1